MGKPRPAVISVAYVWDERSPSLKGKLEAAGKKLICTINIHALCTQLVGARTTLVLLPFFLFVECIFHVLLCERAIASLIDLLRIGLTSCSARFNKATS